MQKPAVSARITFICLSLCLFSSPHPAALSHGNRRLPFRANWNMFAIGSPIHDYRV
jgi:hypothetical protein